jgi:hypothetical protein
VTDHHDDTPSSSHDAIMALLDKVTAYVSSEPSVVPLAVAISLTLVLFAVTFAQGEFSFRLGCSAYRGQCTVHGPPASPMTPSRRPRCPFTQAHRSPS